MTMQGGPVPHATADSGAPVADRRRKAQVILAAGGSAALVIFVLVLVASMRRTPGIGGLLSGIFIGLFSALFLGAGAAWAAMALLAVQPAPKVDGPSGNELMSTLQPVLAELEASRLQVVRQVNARSLTRVPLGAAAGLALWGLEQLGGRSDHGGIAGMVWNAVCLVGFGAMAGYYSAARDSSDAYARMYLGRVLPLLAKGFGNLSFRSPAKIDLQALTAERFFDEFDRAVANNEFYGAYRGLPISIVTLLLTLGTGRQRRVSFEGLLIELTLPRDLKGTTAVIAQKGAFERLRHWLKTSKSQQVDLEDPQFAQLYDVWGTDQIAARALLTPALMGRLLAFNGAAASIDGWPLLMAHDSRLTLIIPRYGRDHFLAPGFRKSAASRAAVIALYQHIADILALAETVIDLDQASRAAADVPALKTADA